MLTLIVSDQEIFDESQNRFIPGKSAVITLEHSLESLSKWERIHGKPFLTDDKKTTAETLSYVKQMILDPDVPDEILQRLSAANLETIRLYIQEKQTATWFKEQKGVPRSSEIVTAELIYYWMISYQIPVDAAKWHLSQLMTLIRVFSEKNNPNKKKPSKTEAAAERHRINQLRRSQANSKG